MTEKTTPTITRRTVAKGAAWAVPALAVGAAAPAMAASTSTCSSCTPTPNLGAGAIVGVAVGNVGTLTMAAPAMTALFSTCTGLLSATIGVVTGATMTMSNGVTYNASSLALEQQVSVLEIGFTGAFVWNNVPMPNGAYLLGNSPITPTRFCITYGYLLDLNGASLNCSNTLCWDADVSVVAGAVALGLGTITWTTVWS